MTVGFRIPEDEIRKKAHDDGITHLSTGVAVVRGGKILVVRRHLRDYLGGNFELPGGGVEATESLEAAVKREVQEETGLGVTMVLGMFPGFDYSTPKKPQVRQLNFLVAAEGSVRLSDEHDRYEWLSKIEDADKLLTTPAMKTCFEDALAVAEDLQ